jgi:hypothetical protein
MTSHPIDDQAIHDREETVMKGWLGVSNGIGIQRINRLLE